MAPIMPNASAWWDKGTWVRTDVLCQKVLPPIVKDIWSDENYIFRSFDSTMLFQLTLILITSTMTCRLLRPLRMPFFGQIVAGVILGTIYRKFDDHYVDLLVPQPILFTFNTIEFFGFTMYSFMLGVETNKDAIKSIGKKAFAIGIAGVLTSLAFANIARFYIDTNFPEESQSRALVSLTSFGASSFFMVTCSHLNDLGISNSDLGRMAASASILVDVCGMILSFIMFNFYVPLFRGGEIAWKPLTAILYYLWMFFACKPLVGYIVSLTPEGRPMKQSHFLMIILIVVIIAFVQDAVDQKFSIFLFGFSLPGEPLSSILAERMEALTSGVFFPIFCANIGIKSNIFAITKKSYVALSILLFGYAGKFLGVLIISRLSGDLFPDAFALSIILSSKGLLDIATFRVWIDRELMDVEQYTISILHVLITTGIMLPLIRLFYTPARQYSAILNRRSVIEAHENGTLQTLACIYKEENIPGIVRLLEICHPTRANPMVVVALQLMQLTGRCAMPIMAPLQQLTSSSAFRSNIARCNHIVNAFLHLERETKGYTHIQHYIAMASYDTMHNDICKLAYEKSVSLIILPFHARWGLDGNIEDSSLSIREVNKKVLQQSPCSVGMLVDRGIGSQLLISDSDVYRIAMLFVGGPDDQEALAYSRIFANHPNVRLVVVSLKGPNSNENEDLDHEVVSQFRNKCKDNERISYREVIVNDGAETTKVVVSMKDVVDLVIVGKHHDLNASAVFGLCTDGWTEYSELGVLGDILSSSDFGFSLLVVQQEPQAQHDLDIEIDH